MTHLLADRTTFFVTLPVTMMSLEPSNVRSFKISSHKFFCGFCRFVTAYQTHTNNVFSNLIITYLFPLFTSILLTKRTCIIRNELESFSWRVLITI